MSSFNNREIATAIWLLLFIAFTARSRSVRESFGGLLRCFWNRHILGGLLAMLLYTVGVVYLLARAGLWTPAVLKDTIIWFCFTGFVLTISTVTDQGEGLFKKVVKESIKVVLIFEFLINEFVFSLPVELVLVPFAAFIALVDAVARRDEKHAIVAKLTGTLLAIVRLVPFRKRPPASRRGVRGASDDGRRSKGVTRANYVATVCPVSVSLDHLQRIRAAIYPIQAW